MTEIQSLARGLKILDILSQSSQGSSITELAECLGIDKGSASRLVSTLVYYGYAEKNSTSRRYHLGPQVVSLSRAVLARQPFHEVARPFLQQLMENTGECAHLAVLAQGKALYVDQVESPATLRVNVQIGHLAPLHCTALGKVLLAFGRADIPSSLEPYTPNTITNPEELLQRLEEVRQQGFAVDNEEFDHGVRCIAVPVFDIHGKMVAALGISGPSSRMTSERLSDLTAYVVAAGKALSDRAVFSR